jgi:hypothetical protein
MGYGLDGRDSITGRGKRCYILHSLQTASGDHAASYPMGIEGAFPGGKAVEA